MGFSPLLWLCLALGAALPATYGIMAVKRDMAATAAYKSGRDDAAKIIAAEVTSTHAELPAFSVAACSPGPHARRISAKMHEMPYH